MWRPIYCTVKVLSDCKLNYKLINKKRKECYNFAQSLFRIFLFIKETGYSSNLKYYFNLFYIYIFICQINLGSISLRLVICTFTLCSSFSFASELLRYLNCDMRVLFYSISDVGKSQNFMKRNFISIETLWYSVQYPWIVVIRVIFIIRVKGLGLHNREPKISEIRVSSSSSSGIQLQLHKYWRLLTLITYSAIWKELSKLQHKFCPEVPSVIYFGVSFNLFYTFIVFSKIQLTICFTTCNSQFPV